MTDPLLSGPPPWIDISLPLRDGMICWPGDPPPRVTQATDVDGITVTRLKMSAHTGTHIDAPAHFFQDGATISAMPPDAMIGPARVLSIQDPESVKEAELERWNVQKGERILLRTANSGSAWWEEPFREQFVFITATAARHLVQRGVRSVGIDYLSVDAGLDDLFETHQILLRAGVWVMEGLDLTEVEPGEYELICLPLRLVDADGAPSRALVRKRV